MYPRDLPMLSTATPMPLAPLMPEEYLHQGLSAIQMAAILRAYWKQSLAIALGVMLTVAAACALWPRTYEATATLMVAFDVNDPLGGRDFPTGLLGSYMATQVELARGSEVLLPVIERLGLARRKNYAAGYSGEPDGLLDWVEARVRRNLVVAQGHFGSQLIYVTYASSNRAEAAQVANAVAEVYSQQQHQRLTGPASERAQRYTAQLADLKEKVDRAQERVTAFRLRTGLIDTTGAGNVDTLSLAALEQRLQEAQSAHRLAQARSATDSAVGNEVLASPMIQSLKTQVAVQGAHLAELKATLGSRHPQVLELESQLRVSRQSLAAELNSYSGNAAAALSSAALLEQKLSKAVADQRLKVLAIRRQQDDGAKYQLELDSAQTVYKRALDGYDQVMFASSGSYSNLNIVGRAKPPARASKPKTTIILLLGVVAGIGLGIALPFCYELLNRRVRCRDDLERDLGIPVLAELAGFAALPSASMRGAT